MIPFILETVIDEPACTGLVDVGDVIPQSGDAERDEPRPVARNDLVPCTKAGPCERRSRRPNKLAAAYCAAVSWR